MNEEKHQLLENILADAKRDPLFFEEALEHSGISSRNLMQMYMMYKFKWTVGTEMGRDPGWDVATNQWVDRGFAKWFADLYDGRLKPSTLYQRLLDREQEHLNRPGYSKEQFVGLNDHED